MKAALEDRKNDLLVQQQTMNTSDKDRAKYVSFGLGLLQNVRSYYEEAEAPVKSKIIGSIFPENLYFENKKYRTTKINELFTLRDSPTLA